MKRRREEVRPPIVESALEQAWTFPGGTCLVCGGRAKPFTSGEVPKLLPWLRGEVSDDELGAAVLLAHPGVEGCFVAEASGISVCATKGVTR